MLLAGIGLALATVVASAYVCSEGSPRRPTGPVVMPFELGPSPGTLIDGSSSWGASAESTFAEWNAYLSGRQMQPVRDSTSPQRDG